MLQYIKQVIVKLFTNDKPLENQCGVKKYYSNVKKKNFKVVIMKGLAIAIS